MEKLIVLGWAKFPNETRRHKITAYVELRVNEQGKAVLSIFGEIKGRAYGQCLDDIKKYAVEKRQNFDEILEVWEAWHLNDVHAGTEKQEQALKQMEIDNFDDACEFLKEKGLYIDNSYRYGSKWLYRPIPESVLDKIFNW